MTKRRLMSRRLKENLQGKEVTIGQVVSKAGFPVAVPWVTEGTEDRQEAHKGQIQQRGQSTPLLCMAGEKNRLIQAVRKLTMSVRLLQ